jgi:hypothetical protein
MSDTQFDLNIDNLSKSEIEFNALKKKVEEIAESAGKVRKKLFAEVSELKKKNKILEDEIEALKLIIDPPKKAEFEYITDDSLFEIKEA